MTFRFGSLGSFGGRGGDGKLCGGRGYHRLRRSCGIGMLRHGSRGARNTHALFTFTDFQLGDAEFSTRSIKVLSLRKSMVSS